MYQAGMAKERADAMAAAGIMEGTGNAVDFDGDNWEQEAEELLEWTADLDYDTYFREWSTVGTSGTPFPHFFPFSLFPSPYGVAFSRDHIDRPKWYRHRSQQRCCDPRRQCR